MKPYYNKKQRLAIYKEGLKYMLSHLPWSYGLCMAVKEGIITMNGRKNFIYPKFSEPGDPYNRISIEYPELYAHKPKDGGTMWFPNESREFTAERIDILIKVIDSMTKKK